MTYGRNLFLVLNLFLAPAGCAGSYPEPFVGARAIVREEELSLNHSLSSRSDDEVLELFLFSQISFHPPYNTVRRAAAQRLANRRPQVFAFFRLRPEYVDLLLDLLRDIEAREATFKLSQAERAELVSMIAKEQDLTVRQWLTRQLAGLRSE